MENPSFNLIKDDLLQSRDSSGVANDLDAILTMEVQHQKRLPEKDFMRGYNVLTVSMLRTFDFLYFLL